jgi:TonB family protein
MSELAVSHVSEPRPAVRRVWLLAAIFFAAQLAAIFFLGTKKANVPRAVANVPHLALAKNSDALIALGDPTLFVLPHLNDFSTRLWLAIPQAPVPDFRRREEPRYLSLDPRNLGAALKDYLQTNTAAGTPLEFKPALALEVAAAATEVFLPTRSALKITGALAGRKLSASILPPTLLVNDVISPSTVQLLVGADGNVISTALLESSGLESADQAALKLANAAQFAPAPQPMFGEMIFTWHTAVTNNPLKQIRHRREKKSPRH